MITGDGSHSLYLPHLDEHYHSEHGALRESEHVFIQHGLEYLFANGVKDFRIFEMGFGTGLNALLTLKFMLNNPSIKISYTSIEANPLPESLISRMNYPDVMHVPELKDAFLSMHSFTEGEKEIKPGFTLTRISGKIENFKSENKFNLVYYDAFGPRVQPELWSENVFRKMASLMEPKSILVTYCAQGEFRRTLKKLGFSFESLPGPPGKREMTRAKK